MRHFYCNIRYFFYTVRWVIAPTKLPADDGTATPKVIGSSGHPRSATYVSGVSEIGPMKTSQSWRQKALWKSLQSTLMTSALGRSRRIRVVSVKPGSQTLTPYGQWRGNRLHWL